MGLSLRTGSTAGLVRASQRHRALQIDTHRQTHRCILIALIAAHLLSEEALSVEALSVDKSRCYTFLVSAGRHLVCARVESGAGHGCLDKNDHPPPSLPAAVVARCVVQLRRGPLRGQVASPSPPAASLPGAPLSPAPLPGASLPASSSGVVSPASPPAAVVALRCFVRDQWAAATSRCSVREAVAKKARPLLLNGRSSLRSVARCRRRLLCRCQHARCVRAENQHSVRATIEPSV